MLDDVAARAKTVANVEIEVRRILDRVLRDLREDAEAFGIDPES